MADIARGYKSNFPRANKLRRNVVTNEVVKACVAIGSNIFLSHNAKFDIEWHLQVEKSVFSFSSEAIAIAGSTTTVER